MTDLSILAPANSIREDNVGGSGLFCLGTGNRLKGYGRKWDFALSVISRKMGSRIK